VPWGILALVAGAGAAAFALRRMLAEQPLPRVWAEHLVEPLQHVPEAPSATPLPAEVARDAVEHAEAPQGAVDQMGAAHEAPVQEQPPEVPSPGMANLEGKELATVTPESVDDIRAVMHEVLGENPDAEFRDVLAAWHVRRGTTIDDAETQRVREVFEREMLSLRPGAGDAAA